MSAHPALISLRELALLQLPGIPKTARGVDLLAKREQWATVRGPNRTQLIVVEQLPPAYLKRVAEAFPSQIRTAPSDAADSKRRAGRPSGTDFFAKNPEVADFILAILMQQKIPATHMMELLQTSFVCNLPSARSLRRFIWENSRKASLVQADGTQTKRCVGRPVGTDFFSQNPDVADAALAIIAQGKTSAPKMLNSLKLQFGEQLPSERTMQHFIRKHVRKDAWQQAKQKSQKKQKLHYSRKRFSRFSSLELAAELALRIEEGSC